MPEHSRTTCPYCGVGCGVVAERNGERLDVRGDPDHPANRGRLCVKGAALGETVDLAGRLLHPMIGPRRVSWETALDAVADGFGRAIAAHGPDSTAFYVSGQLLTEDYYVANKLMKGFIGSANIDTNSRLCMASSVAGHVRAFGADTVPGCYEDLDLADLVVLVGSNAAWCHPILFQRIQAAKQARPAVRVVAIDPRRTATTESADLHLAIRPGSDVALFNGLLLSLVGAGAIDHAFVTAHTNGLAAALAAAAGPPTASVCDVDAEDLQTFYRWFAATERVVTVYSQGVNQSSRGTDKVNAIINCHLLSGRIGRPGMGPFSFTGQPNAMGGREVGGLANQLAAHMGFDAAARDRVRRFWRAPAVAGQAGLKAVDLFDAVGQGRIKALWVIATNPAVSLPDATLVAQALKTCDLVVTSDCMAITDTTRHAHIRLPALAWGEKDGTVTNSERCISRQRAVLPAPGEARPDWWMLCEVAKRLGHGDAFRYAGPAEIFLEHAALSAFENQGARAFDIGGLCGADYDALTPIQWPVTADRQPTAGTARLYADGRYGHPDGRARFVAVAYHPPVDATTPELPLILNTGRLRDQWHTMTRTGKSPRLAAHAAEPCLAVHPDDATAWGLVDDGWADIESRRGRSTLRVTVTDAQRVGEVYAPIHWNDQVAGAAVVSRLMAANVDPHSGQPELKVTPVRVTPVTIFWEAVLLSRHPFLPTDSTLLWSRAAGREHVVYRLAGRAPNDDWRGWTRTHLGANAEESGDWIEYQDRGLGVYRAALLREDRLTCVLLVGPPRPQPIPETIAARFGRGALDAATRAGLLSGLTESPSDGGQIVCACHSVGRVTILNAITMRHLTSVEGIGAALRAGTNCGSCIPELRGLLQQARVSTPINQEVER